MKHGKHYVDAAKLVDSTKLYEVNEALELACKTASAKFDETVELHVRLGVDGRHADQQVRGAVVLPNGTGKTVRVCAIAKGPAAAAAEAAQAHQHDSVEEPLLRYRHLHHHYAGRWRYDAAVARLLVSARQRHGTGYSRCAVLRQVLR